MLCSWTKEDSARAEPVSGMEGRARGCLSFLPVSQEILEMPELIEVCLPPVNADLAPRTVLCCEIARAKPSLKALGIGFSVSYARKRMKRGKPRKPPYFASCYNVGDLGDINIVAFYHPLIADWDLM